MPLSNVLAVWGSPSSGKTVVSSKIAQYLTGKRKNIALLLCDMTTPSLPLLLPPSEIEQERSLGSILAATHVVPELVMHNCVTLKKNSYLSVIGMLKGENVFTYPKYDDTQAAQLIQILSELADYVVIDCGSYIAYDVLSTVSIMNAGTVLRLINCDLKSISYLSSQLPLLMDTKFRADSQLKIASNVKSAHANMEQILGGVSLTIPHCEEVENQYFAGELLRELPIGKSTKIFRKAIETIAEEVFDV